MKISEMLTGQKIIIQLVFGDNTLEFNSEVLEKDTTNIYVKPYFHNGNELELTVTPDKDVLCNVFTNDPVTAKRISWKGIELATVKRNDATVYSLKTNGFNESAKHDDRRVNDRTIVHQKGMVYDFRSDKGNEIMIHDISVNGISFYAPASYSPKSQQIHIAFSDVVNGRHFHVKVDCTIARTSNKAGNSFYGCKVVGDNKEYALLIFVKHLVGKGN